MLTLYQVVLDIHSILRWLVILTALFVLIRTLTGLSFKRGFMGMDNRAAVWFTGTMDLQVLVGIILYFFLSPITTQALQNFNAAMTIHPASAMFFTVEHAAAMVVAAVVAHVGRASARRAPTGLQKHQRSLIFYSLSLVIVLAAIPWPFLSYGRPLLF